MPAVKTLVGYVDELTTPEMFNLLTGAGIGIIGHVIGESFADNYFKDKYPDKYPMYSTLAVSAVLSALGLGLIIYGYKKPDWRLVLSYIGFGILMVEVMQIADLIRVKFELG